MEKKPTPHQLRAFARQHHIPSEALEDGLKRIGAVATPADWLRGLGHFLLWAGLAFALAGIIFFFAYNWDDLNRFQKLGLVGGMLLATIALAWYKGFDALAGKASLIGASVLVGALLAVYGQVYQTDADAYSLYLTWTLLIAGWVYMGQSRALWLLWMVLANLSLGLWWGQAGPG